MYLKTLPEYAGSRWEANYNNNVLLRSVKKLEEQVNGKGQLMPGMTEAKLTKYLEEMRDTFKKRGYGSFSYDDSLEGTNNFSTLNQLTKNC